MADMHGFLTTHLGKPGAGIRNPGSLLFHNTLLRHLPITPTSLPPFRTCRDLVFVSLYGRILHCLLLVSGKSSLEEYIATVDDWDTVKLHAERIRRVYANPAQVQNLRQQRADSTASSNDTSTGGEATSSNSCGDMVYENALLFLRDGLVSREFTDAVKAGDSGRVLLVLKHLALSFRGNGRSKYAYEMLTIIHNLEKVWPKKIVNIVLKNWLLNPTGRPNSFVEVDLVQEHMNFWIKTFYKAHGPNSSWEWLETISPCVPALRDLANSMKAQLGTDIGTRHAPPDLSRDIKVLMESLRDHRVYSLVPGRKLDDDDSPVVDVVCAGLQQLSEGPSLLDYNTMFRKLKTRRAMRPVWTEGAESDSGSDMEGSTNGTSVPVTTTAAPPPNSTESDSSDWETDDDMDEENHLTHLDLDETLDLTEPTLECVTAADVALDMDTVEVEIDDQEPDDDDDDNGLYSDESSDEEGDEYLE